MNRAATILTASVLAAALGVAAFATPALADYRLVGQIANCSSPGDTFPDWSFDMMAAKLRQRGISYNSIGTFANCFIVRTTDAYGDVVDVLFDPLTFRPAL